ncbi:MAG TPA: N-acetyltransferase, partial [Thermoplasmata archaeon]|nr:N-acetyltransferase [Thermoplasmata archaeon]
ALYELEELCFAERRFRKEHLLYILKNPRAASFVYENGSVLGSLMVQDEKVLTRVLSIGVHPRHRRQGIGRALMSTAEDTARRFRSPKVRLEVNTNNRGALAFYQTLGYEILETLPRYYSWGDDAYAMAKPVAPLVRNP